MHTNLQHLENAFKFAVMALNNELLPLKKSFSDRRILVVVGLNNTDIDNIYKLGKRRKFVGNDYSNKQILPHLIIDFHSQSTIRPYYLVKTKLL